MKTTYRLVDFALKRMPTDGSGYGTAIAYGWGAKDEEPVFDRGGLYVERLPLPLLWQHERGVGDIDTIIGRVTAERTTTEGWEIDFKLDLSANELALKVYERMLSANDAQFSVGFAYDKKDLYEGDDGLVHLRRSEVIEVSVVTVGANRGTRLVSLKSAEARRVASRSAEAPAAPPLSKLKEMYPDAWHEIEVARGRDAATKAKIARREAAHRYLDDLYRMNPAPSQVVLDRRGRVVGGDEAERDAARQAREAKDREHRARERERERVAAEAGAESLRAGSTSQVTRGA